MAQLLTPQEIMFTNFEPKVANRFIMYIEGIPAYLIKAANRPELQQNRIIHTDMKPENILLTYKFDQDIFRVPRRKYLRQVKNKINPVKFNENIIFI